MAYRLASGLLLPFPLIVLAILALAVVGFVRRRPGRWLWLGAAIALVACSNGIVAWALAGTLEWPLRRVTLPARPPAMVVLSGSMVLGPDGQPVLAHDSLVRTLYAAELGQRLRPAWIVVTGGPAVSAPGGGPVAAAMRDLLVQLGAAADRILVEGESATTYENAIFTKRLLGKRGIREIVLVTEALHMPRALATFRTAGLDATPAPCAFLARDASSVKDVLLPDPWSALTLQRVAHEWAGIAWYRWRGYIGPVTPRQAKGSPR
jgi:uncharacterized SAM-binding protein YcdF (DUF218 family)